MTDVAIRVQGLSKLYRIGERQRYKSLRETIMRNLGAPFRKGGRRPPETIWALDDVSFEVMRGEVVGVIGRNGAGKTTLLKILSRITEPTEGRVELHGRVGSLLEVGTGFHPELTGRENIYLNGAILGMRRAEIARKFDEIVDFAEVERFIDTPVKHFSTGMYLRLAFAVAAHLEPEILLVDEVLAVGDAAFQKKCMGKMDEVARSGRAVLFVSHNLQAVAALTARTLLFDAGSLVFAGSTTAALERYRAIVNPTNELEFTAPEKREGVLAARVTTSSATGVHAFGAPLLFEFEVRFAEHPGAAAFSFQIVDETARPIAHLWLLSSEVEWWRPGTVKLCCRLPRPRLYMGCYTLTTHLSDRACLHQIETLTGICKFEITMDGVPREYAWAGGACTYLEDGEWSVS